MGLTEARLPQPTGIGADLAAVVGDRLSGGGGGAEAHGAGHDCHLQFERGGHLFGDHAFGFALRLGAALGNLCRAQPHYGGGFPAERPGVESGVHPAFVGAFRHLEFPEWW